MEKKMFQSSKSSGRQQSLDLGMNWGAYPIWNGYPLHFINNTVAKVKNSSSIKLPACDKVLEYEPAKRSTPH